VISPRKQISSGRSITTVRWISDSDKFGSAGPEQFLLERHRMGWQTGGTVVLLLWKHSFSALAENTFSISFKKITGGKTMLSRCKGPLFPANWMFVLCVACP